MSKTCPWIGCRQPLVEITPGVYICDNPECIYWSLRPGPDLTVVLQDNTYKPPERKEISGIN